MRAVRRPVLVILLAGVFAGCAAVATANPLQWWVKPAGPWTALPLGVPETLNSKGGIAFFEAGGKNAKCLAVDREKIENPLSGGPGVDQVEVFAAECSVSPLGFNLCANAERMEVRGHSLNWPSLLELVGTKKEERFTGTELEFECLPSAALSTATEFTPVRPTVSVDKLKFTGVSSGELESGSHKIWIKGVETLTPSIYQKVKAEI